MSVALTPAERAQRYELVRSHQRASESIASIARRLGMGEEYLRNWLRDYKAERLAQEKAATKVRPCLKCGRNFSSRGAGNRMCDPCRSHSHLTSPYAPDPGGSTGRRVQPALRGPGPR